MTAPTPMLAIMGHPNAGKSSVVATLTENDRIAIDKRAGTTTRSDAYPVVIDGRTIMTFVDTPGFQNPDAILDWFHAQQDELNLASAFIAAHQADRLFSHDCALLDPVAQGAGIILVVDGSKRIKAKDRTEMELLRLTGRPRMAILNNLSANQEHMPAWQDALNKCFNSVRVFNAHRAAYSERIALLQALKSIDQRWEPMLDETLKAFERDWANRLDQAAQIIQRLLQDALGMKLERIIKDEGSLSEEAREEQRQRLLTQFQDQLRALERQARNEIRALFRHHVWDPEPESLLTRDLFSAEVEQALGLTRAKLAVTGLAAGAATGGAIDVGVGGLSLGTAALIGGVTGGALGVLGGAALAKVDIRRRLGLARITVGPVTNPRFPFVLLDRMMLYCLQAMNWSHGRQAADESSVDRVPDRQLKRKQGFTQELSSADQHVLAQFFRTARKGQKPGREEAVQDILRAVLRHLSEADLDARSSL